MTVEDCLAKDSRSRTCRVFLDYAPNNRMEIKLLVRKGSGGVAAAADAAKWDRESLERQ